MSCVIFIIDVSAGATPVPGERMLQDCHPDPTLPTFKRYKKKGEWKKRKIGEKRKRGQWGVFGEGGGGRRRGQEYDIPFEKNKNVMRASQNKRIGKVVLGIFCLILI